MSRCEENRPNCGLFRQNRVVTGKVDLAERMIHKCFIPNYKGLEFYSTSQEKREKM